MHAHGRQKHCYMKRQISGQESVSRIKFGIVFDIILFPYYFFSTNHIPENTELNGTNLSCKCSYMNICYFLVCAFFLPLLPIA